MKNNSLKKLLLIVVCAIAVIVASNVWSEFAYAYEVGADTEINKECTTKITTNKDGFKKYDECKVEANYLIRFKPEETGEYDITFSANITSGSSDYSIQYCFMNAESDYLQKFCYFGKNNVIEKMHCVRGKTYYIPILNNDDNSYNVMITFNYLGNNNYKPEILCNNRETERINMYKGAEYDPKSRTLNLENYEGLGFDFSLDNGGYVFDTKDFSKEDFTIKIIVKGKNKISDKTYEYYTYYSFAGEGLSLKFEGDGELEVLAIDENTYSYEYGCGIKSDKDIIIDGPTIKTDTIYALNNLYVKSGSINLIGRIRAINAYFNGGEVNIDYTSESNYFGYSYSDTKTAGNYTHAMDIDNCNLNGTDFNIVAHNLSAIFATKELNYKAGYIYVKLYHTVYDYSWSGYAGYADVFTGEKIKIDGGALLVEYEKKPDNIQNVTKERFLNKVIYASEECEINKLDIILLGDESFLKLFKDEGMAPENVNDFVVFAKGKDTKKFNVNMKNVKLTKTSSYDVSSFRPKKNDKVLNTSDVIAGPKKGSKITDGKLIYKVIKTGTLDGKKVGKVTVVGLKKKSLKKVSIKSVLIYEGVKYKVTAIGKKAFKNGKKLKSIVIGKNVSKISKGAFAGCKKLKSIKIKSKKIKKFAKGTFKGVKNTCVIKVAKAKKKAYTKKIKKAGFKGIIK